MRPGGLLPGFVLLSLWACNNTWALTLGEAVERAVNNDPTYLAATASREVSRERSRQALANLLPQISITANSSSNQRNYTLQNANRNNTPTERYNSNSAQLNLTQPLLHHANFIALKQADIVVGQADYELASAGQELLVRLAQAWFDVMQAQDEVRLSAEQLKVAKQQAELAKRNNDLGVMSRTEREAGLAKYEQAMADDAAARSGLEIKQAALEQILGTTAVNFPVLADSLPEPVGPGDTLDHWLEQALRDSQSLLAAQRAWDAAEEEIRKQRAGHEPTLDIVASHGKTSQGSGLVGGQSGFTSLQDTLGLQFNMPLFSGGMQIAKTGEAIALRDKAKYDYEAALRNVRLSVKQAWFTWRAAHARYKSAQQQIAAAELELKGAAAAEKRGVKARLDVLKAQEQRESAWRDWRKARYDMIVSGFKLKAAAGELHGDDLAGLDQWFVARNVPR